MGAACCAKEHQPPATATSEAAKAEAEALWRGQISAKLEAHVLKEHVSRSVGILAERASRTVLYYHWKRHKIATREHNERCDLIEWRDFQRQELQRRHKVQNNEFRDRELLIAQLGLSDSLGHAEGSSAPRSAQREVEVRGSPLTDPGAMDRTANSVSRFSDQQRTWSEVQISEPSSARTDYLDPDHVVLPSEVLHRLKWYDGRDEGFDIQANVLTRSASASTQAPRDRSPISKDRSPTTNRSPTSGVSFVSSNAGGSTKVIRALWNPPWQRGGLWNADASNWQYSNASLNSSAASPSVSMIDTVPPPGYSGNYEDWGPNQVKRRMEVLSRVGY